jgi:hypothetical protein
MLSHVGEEVYRGTSVPNFNLLPQRHPTQQLTYSKDISSSQHLWFTGTGRDDVDARIRRESKRKTEAGVWRSSFMHSAENRFRDQP